MLRASGLPSGYAPALRPATGPDRRGSGSARPPGSRSSPRGRCPGSSIRNRTSRPAPPQSADPGHPPLGDHRLHRRFADPDPRRPGPGPSRRLARIPIEGQKTRDITGGLPRVAEFFEARMPEGRGHARRDHRHGSLRQRDEGQGPPADHRPGRQGLRRAGAEGEAHPRARRPGREPRRTHRRRLGRPAGHPAPAGRSRNWRATSSTRCRTSTVCRA